MIFCAWLSLLFASFAETTSADTYPGKAININNGNNIFFIVIYMVL